MLRRGLCSDDRIIRNRSYGTGSLNITDKGYVTSSIVAILGYQAGSNGQVVVEKGGEWLIKITIPQLNFKLVIKERGSDYSRGWTDYG